MPPKNTHYAYFLPNGESGIVVSWAKCEKIVQGKQGVRYKGFRNLTEAENWLSAGAKYEIKTKKKMPDGVYFDAGTGRGNGVEISVTNKNGINLLNKVLANSLINKHGKYLLPKGKTNNYGELLALKYALEIATIINEKNIFGDSKLAIDYWSKGFIKKEVANQTKTLAYEVMNMRREFEDLGGTITLISGDDNPADLGFH